MTPVNAVPGKIMSREGISYQNILVETCGKVGLIRLNRPQALNALNRELMQRIDHALDAFEADPDIGCMVITGSDKAFAAGADIKEMADKTFADVFLGDFAAAWDRAATVRKPVIAAVAGFALGGGCELAMLCDLIIAADNAKFGQPEIKLGVIPGIGGTQRLTRAVGKAKAMDLILTGRMMDAQEAERGGLVARIVPLASLVDEAVKVAETIASMSLPSVLVAKEAVNRAFETTLAEGRALRTAAFSFAVRDRRPERGHGGVHRQAAAQVQEQIVPSARRLDAVWTRLSLRARDVSQSESGNSKNCAYIMSRCSNRTVSSAASSLASRATNAALVAASISHCSGGSGSNIAAKVAL